MTNPDFSHHFSVENIPFGVASSKRHGNPQCVTRIENNVIFLQDLANNGFLSEVAGLSSGIFSESTLNSFAALEKSVHHNVRISLQQLYSSNTRLPDGATEDISVVTMHLPVMIGDFTGIARFNNIVDDICRLRKHRFLVQSESRQKRWENCRQRRKTTSSILSSTSMLRRKSKFNSGLWYTNTKTNWTVL
jgi:hypothetical protein